MYTFPGYFFKRSAGVFSIIIEERYRHGFHQLLSKSNTRTKLTRATYSHDSRPRSWIVDNNKISMRSRCKQYFFLDSNSNSIHFLILSLIIHLYIYIRVSISICCNWWRTFIPNSSDRSNLLLISSESSRGESRASMLDRISKKIPPARYFFVSRLWIPKKARSCTDSGGAASIKKIFPKDLNRL